MAKSNKAKPTAFLQILVNVVNGATPQDLGLSPVGAKAVRLLQDAVSLHNTPANPMPLMPADLEELANVEGWNGGKPVRFTSEGTVQTAQVVLAAIAAHVEGDEWAVLAEFPNCERWEEVAARRDARDYKVTCDRFDDRDVVNEAKWKAIDSITDWADVADDFDAEYTRLCALLGVPER